MKGLPLPDSNPTRRANLPLTFATVHAATHPVHSDRVAWAFTAVLPYESRLVARQCPGKTVAEAAVKAATEAAKLLPTIAPSVLLVSDDMQAAMAVIKDALSDRPLLSVIPASSCGDADVAAFATSAREAAEAEAHRAGAF